MSGSGNEAMPRPGTHLLENYHEDKNFRDELVKYLDRSSIGAWHDREIDAYTTSGNQVDSNLNLSQIVLLLISVDFTASDYCYGVEMQRALERHEAGEVIVIPVIIRPVNWKSAPFSRLHILPAGCQPVSIWTEPDKAYQDVARGIRRAINKILKQQYMNDAEIDVKNKRYESALVAYEEASQFGEDNPALYQGKAAVFYALNRFDEALSAYQQAIWLEPERAQCWRGKGQTLVHLNRFDEACKAYEQAIQLTPDNPYLYKEKGDILYHLAHWHEALASYTEAMRLKPDFSSVALSKGRIYEILARQSYDLTKQAEEQAYKKVNEAKEEWI
jgi:tetratricopeptide (TPR) repeat protein